MSTLFVQMDFIQFVNPLYALPIVAVIVCAFLVYAFGFKSPVQPPSFDEIELEKKAHKKRKTKEIHKNKQPNWKAGSSASKVSDSASVIQKRKLEKVTAPVEKPVLKFESKVKKTVLEKKKLCMNPELAPVADNANDDGWIHLSKKGKKKRKRDKAVTSIDSLQVAPNFPGMTAKTSETTEEDMDNGKRSDVAIVEENQSPDLSDTDAKPCGNMLLDNPQPFVSKKKQWTKKGVTQTEADIDDDGKSFVSEEKIKHDVISPAIETESSESPTRETVKPARLKKPKKKKKKTSVVQKEVVDGKFSDSPSSDVPRSITSESSETCLSVMDEVDASSNSVSITEALVQPEKTNSLLAKGKQDVKGSDEVIEAKGSNIAFDEMKGLFSSEVKLQKKKKKVRRER